MPKSDEHREEHVSSKADALAQIQEAEAEVAEAEALAAAARARARAARLKREALTLADDAEDYADAAAAAADVPGEDEDENENDDSGQGVGAAPAEKYVYEDYADEDYEDHEAPDGAVDPAAPTGWRRWVTVSALATAAAVLLVIGFVAASIVMITHHRDVTQRLKQDDAFVAGAKQCVLNMISLDFTKARSDVQRVIDSSTGEFKDDFQKKANDLIALVEKSKAITDGTIDAAALESTAGNSAVVLVAAISRITNSPPDKAEPPKLWRLRVTIADEGGQYKMSKVDYVQ